MINNKTEIRPFAVLLFFNISSLFILLRASSQIIREVP